MTSAADPSSYREALLFLATAGVVIPVFRRIGFSSILGFLIVGALIGPNMLGALAGTFSWLDPFLFTDTGQFARLAELGVVFLLFLIGIELSLDRLFTMRRLVFGLGGAQVVVSAVILAAIASWLGMNPAEALVIGCALSLSSTAIVVQLLSDQRRLGSQTGRASFAILLFQDLAVIPILLLVDILGTNESQLSATAIAKALLQGVAAIAIILLAGRFVLRPLLRMVAAARSGDLFMAATLLIALGAGYVASLAGLSMALGAFLAGLLLAETEYRHEIEAIIDPFKGLLLGAFFLLVGMGIDLRLIIADPLPMIGIAAGFVVIKAAIIYLLGKLFSLNRRIRTETALLLGPGGEFAFVVAAAATASGVLAAGADDRLLTIVSVSMAAIPILDLLSRPLAKRMAGSAVPRQLADLPPVKPGAVVLIVGFGRVGRLVAEMLAKHQITYLAVDNDPEVVARERKAGRPIYFGDASRPEFLRHCDIAQVRAVAITIDNSRRAEEVAAAARKERPDVRIIARARDDRHAMRLYEIGVAEAVPEAIEASLQLAESVLVEAGVPMGLAIAAIHQHRDDHRKLLGRPNRRAELAELKRARDRIAKQAGEKD